MGKKVNILILGGGFGGLRVALDLAKMKVPNSEIVLVDQSAEHRPHPMLYEVATALLPNNTRVEYRHLRRAVAIPFRQILYRTGVRFMQARVATLALQEKKVTLEGGEQLPFDYLVIALGSETNYFNLASLRGCAYPMKNLDDAINLRNAIEELFSKKKPHDHISLVIGGGGFVGM